MRFCQLNPKPCPLIGMTEPGDPMLPMLGEDIDLRTDLPAYRIFKDGVETDEVTDIGDYWRDDLVGFGCHGHRRRDADKEQQWRHKEAAADSKHARQHTNETAQPQ